MTLKRRPNIDLALDILGWKPSVSRKIELQRTYDYFAP